VASCHVSETLNASGATLIDAYGKIPRYASTYCQRHQRLGDSYITLGGFMDDRLGLLDEPHPRAVKFGRFVFILIGAVLFGVACWFSYKNQSGHVLFAALVMGVGLVLIWLGIMLPPKIVAHLGFWLPGLLPGE
jgi:hypothetical protein